jgi:hypothetical protein
MFIFETNRYGSADELGSLIRQSLRDAVHSFGLEKFTTELERRSGRKIQATLVNAWMSDTKHRWRLPTDLVPFVCEILRDDTIQRLVMSEKHRRALELGESTPRIVSLLKSAIREKPQRRSKR